MKYGDLEKLIRLIENSVINEMELTDFWGRRIRISKNTAAGKPGPTDQPGIAGKTEIIVAPGEITTRPIDVKGNRIPIKSPIVGTFYRSPAPDAPSYVEVGDIVKPGQVVCIIEAMKLMNEIEADVSGKVVEVLVKNESPVEYNQELFLIEPLE